MHFKLLDILKNSLLVLNRFSNGRYFKITMENSPSNLPVSVQLSPLIRPINYTLLLNPDLDAGVFKGNVKIDVTVKEEKKYLNLHSQFLEISNVKVYKSGKEVPVVKFLEDKHLEQLHIHFDNTLSIGNYQIDIDFSGNLTNNIVGFYLSRLKDSSVMVASKFQPTYARQAFPCFDEPDFKATFDITLVKPLNYIALSNMNEISKTPHIDGKSHAVTFATSVPMSTYLTCFVVSDFNFKETEINSNGIGKNFRLRSFAQRHQMHKIDYAQDIGKRCTEYYINYYDVPFPLPKLDMIAIPDYVSGATEHWGLITYRETSFLVDEATTSAQNKINVANTIAHELAHMWFGNLVTMKWWDELWLNEGFATYMQAKSLNAVEPSWTMLDQFLIRTMHSVMVMDSKLSSHPIVQTVATPNQITAIFDSISYNKGASVLRMLEGFVGEENFRKGVSDYLKKHQFGNTQTQDLLASLEPCFKEDNPNLSLTRILDTWTKQMGYPVVTVKRDSEFNTYVITQSRFLLDPEAKYNNSSPFNYSWFIPITFKTNNGPCNNILWFPDTALSVKLVLGQGESWLKLNNNQVGYYRVNYPIEMWHELIQQLQMKSEQLTISDRSHLLNDAFALAEAHAIPYNIALSLTKYLTVEEDYVPWATAFSIFTELSNRLLHSTAHDHLLLFFQKLVEPIYLKQNWEKTDTSVIERLLRTKIFKLAARCQLRDAETKVKKLFLAWLNNYGTDIAIEIETDLRDLIYYYGMKSATKLEWEKLWQIYLKEEDVQELAKLRRALAAPQDMNILKTYLLLAWDEKYVRSQDYLNVLQVISLNPLGTELVWNEVRAHWPQLVERFTLNSRYLGNLIPVITNSFKTTQQLQEMEEFFAKYPDAGAGESARVRALETVRNNIQWSVTRLSVVATWLQTNQF